VFRGYAAAAAERSVAGAVVEHSLVHGTALIGQAAAEVVAGVDRLRAAPGIDPGRVALWFFSGSGLLTARWLEQTPSWLRCLAATYPWFGPPDDLPDLPTAIDAIARAPRLPIVLTRVGLERPDLAAAVERFVAAAESSGANLEIIDVPHGHHGFDCVDHTDESRAAVRQALDRVTAYLTAPLHMAHTARHTKIGTYSASCPRTGVNPPRKVAAYAAARPARRASHMAAARSRPH
jgi:dienelactone hydrolase